MTRHRHRQREYHSPRRPIDLPLQRHKRRREDDHRRDEDDRDRKLDPEPGDDLRDLLEEIRPLDFLLRRAPLDVVGEHVGEDGLRERDGETAEEEEAIEGLLVNNVDESSEEERRKTHKKGIHLIFSKRPITKPLSPKLYSRIVNPILPDPKNTTVVASQISKECM